MSREHLAKIVNSMVIRQGMEPQIADLIPFDINSGRALKFENTAEDLAELHRLIRIKAVHFWAISGQHSAFAAKQIVEWAKKDSKLDSQAALLKLRKSRLLSHKTPVLTLALHSSRSHAASHTMKFQSSFIISISHARRQYFSPNSPRVPKIGDTKIDDDYKVC